jgi:hypothetical protein
MFPCIVTVKPEVLSINPIAIITNKYHLQTTAHFTEKEKLGRTF